MRTDKTRHGGVRLKKDLVTHGSCVCTATIVADGASGGQPAYPGK
jgi:hypothetical protein